MRAGAQWDTPEVVGQYLNIMRIYAHKRQSLGVVFST